MKNAIFYYQDKDAPKPNKPNHIGTSVFIQYQDKLLLEHRKDSDTWAVIGGGLNIDESLIEGAIREVKEETGILLDKKDLEFYKIYDDPTRIASYPDGNIMRIITVVYQAFLNELPNTICSSESRELKFFSRQELKDIVISATHIPIIEDYLLEIESESICLK